MEDVGSSNQLGHPSRGTRRFLLGLIVTVALIVIVLAYNYLYLADPRCATLLAHPDSDVVIPLPTNCMLTTDVPDDETAKSLDAERKRRGLAFRAWISCKASNEERPIEFSFIHDSRWLPSYVPGAYQFRQTVIIGGRPPSKTESMQPTAGGAIVVAEVCLMPRRRYARLISGQCDGKFSVWR